MATLYDVTLELMESNSNLKNISDNSHASLEYSDLQLDALNNLNNVSNIVNQHSSSTESIFQLMAYDISRLVNINLEMKDVFNDGFSRIVDVLYDPSAALKEKEAAREENNKATTIPKANKETKKTKNKGTGFFSGLTGLAGAGIGLGAAGAGLGAFFMGLAGAEAIMQSFGSGDNIKKLLTNLAEGLSAFQGRDLAALGAVLGFGAVAGAVPGLSGPGAGMGMASVGLGLGAFFVGLSAADKTLSFLNTDYSNLKKVTKNLSEALAAMDTNAMTTVGALLGAGAAAGALFGPTKVAKATVGMGAIGLGIGAFFAGLAVGDAAVSWMKTDGTALKNMMTNLGEGLNGLSQSKAGLEIIGGLLGAGGAAGALFSPSKVAGAAVGMGAVGLGLGAFFAGLAAGDAAATWMNADGTALKNIMKNLGEGLAAFGTRDLAALGGLLTAGGIFGAVPGGAAIAGGAAIGMGLIGAGIGAFFVGLGGVGKLGELLGIDGSGLKNILKNTAEGLKPLSDLNGSNLLSVAGGLAAIGPALAAYLGAEGIGSVVGSVLDNAKAAYEWVFGENEGSEKENKFQAIVNSLKPFNQLSADGLEGFVKITEAFDAFAEAIEKMIDLDIDDFEDNLEDIVDAIKDMPDVSEKKLKLISSIGKVQVPNAVERYNELSSEEQASAIEKQFGMMGQGGGGTSINAPTVNSNIINQNSSTTIVKPSPGPVKAPMSPSEAIWNVNVAP